MPTTLERHDLSTARRRSDRPGHGLAGSLSARAGSHARRTIRRSRDVRMRMRLPCHTGRTRQHPGYWRSKLTAPPPRPFRLEQIWPERRGSAGLPHREPTLIRASFRFDVPARSSIPAAGRSLNSPRGRGIAFALTQICSREKHLLDRWQRGSPRHGRCRPAGGIECRSDRFAQQFERPAERAHPFVHSGQTAAKTLSGGCRHRHRRPRQTADRIGS